ncbi:ankyrin repeat domain-containing protein [Micromonospora sp. NBC_01405]|uniref:ankyrin repeat domain-containing protein n=1 Tax=Micromonospora sp. NBC_01405 TaxID=2903589 RepID=UPI0032555724
MEAVRREDATAVGALLRAGADPNAADNDGITPLYQASVAGAAELVRLLLTAGAAPDTESGRGQEGTPLCAAAAWGGTAPRRVAAAGGQQPRHQVGRLRAAEQRPIVPSASSVQVVRRDAWTV